MLGSLGYNRLIITMVLKKALIVLAAFAVAVSSARANAFAPVAAVRSAAGAVRKTVTKNRFAPSNE